MHDAHQHWHCKKQFHFLHSCGCPHVAVTVDLALHWQDAALHSGLFHGPGCLRAHHAQKNDSKSSGLGSFGNSDSKSGVIS